MWHAPEDWLLHLVAVYGAWVVFACVAIEAAGIPVPSEGTLIATAALAADRHAHWSSVVPIIIAATAGAVLGDNVGYAVGRSIGPPLLRRFGPRIGLTAQRQRLGRLLFARYGGWVVFIARFVSVLRTCVSLLAGTTRMPWPRFLVFNASGAIVWATLVGGGAYAFGRDMRAWSWPVSAAVAIVAVILLVGAYRLLRRQEQVLQAEADRLYAPADQMAVAEA